MKKLLVSVLFTISLFGDTNSLSTSIELINKQEYKKAIEILQNINQEKYNKFDINYLIGYSYNMIGEYHNAISYLELAKKANPSSYQIYPTLGYTYIALDMLDVANNLFDEYIKIAPKEDEGYYLKGFVLYQKSDYKQSKEFLQKALELNHKNTKATVYLGLCSGRLGLFSDSAYLLQQSIKENKEIANTILNQAINNLNDINNLNTQALLGAIYFAQNKNDLALSNYLRIYKLYEDDKFLNTIIAQIYINKNDYNKAITYLQKAINNGAKNPHTYYLLGFCYYHISSYTLAIKNLKLAISKDNTYAKYHISLAKAYEADEQNKNAIAEYKKALAIDSTLIEAIKKIAINEVENQNYTNALEMLLKVYKDNTDEDIAYNIGFCYLLLNNFKEANIYLKEAINLSKNKNNFYYFYYLGYTYYATSQYKEAIKTLQNAIDLKPDSDAYYYIALSFANEQNLEKMAEYLKKSLEQNSENLNATFMLGSYFFKNALYKEAISYLKKVASSDNENKQKATLMLQEAIKGIN